MLAFIKRNRPLTMESFEHNHICIMYLTWPLQDSTNTQIQLSSALTIRLDWYFLITTQHIIIFNNNKTKTCIIWMSNFDRFLSILSFPTLELYLNFCSGVDKLFLAGYCVLVTLCEEGRGSYSSYRPIRIQYCQNPNLNSTQSKVRGQPKMKLGLTSHHYLEPRLS